MDGSLLLSVHVRHRLSRLELQAELWLGEETLALVGPSGAGKTSTLRAIAGLFRPDEGRIRFRDEVWFDGGEGINLPPERRRVGMVFQDGALFPHMTVAQNVAFGMRRRVPAGDHGAQAVRDSNRSRLADRRRRARAVGATLERFGLTPLARARPGSLSGGEQRLVALARAVASRPAVLLLDEPLASLDADTRADVGTELWRHVRDLRIPAIVVSHEFPDVVGLADRIAVMEAGRIVQFGTAADLLEAPASSFVAALTGVNYFPGVVVRRADLTEVRSAASDALFVSTDEAGGAVGVVVYPWEVALSATVPEGSARNALAGPVRRVAGVGNRVRVTVESSPPIVAEVTEESLRRLNIAPGVPVVATWKATGTRLVPRPGGLLRPDAAARTGRLP